MEEPSGHDIIKNTKMAGEALAWFDEKNWTDEEKVCVAAGILPVLMARIAKDKAQFDKIRAYFLSVIDRSADIAWKSKRASSGDVE